MKLNDIITRNEVLQRNQSQTPIIRGSLMTEEGPQSSQNSTSLLRTLNHRLGYMATNFPITVGTSRLFYYKSFFFFFFFFILLQN